MELLSLWLREQQQGDVDEETLIQRATEAESLIDVISQQISSALPTSVAHVPIIDKLREILAGRQPVELRTIESSLAASKPTPKQVRAKIESLPHLRRWVRRVEELDRGIWLTYEDREGQKRRMQLVWISKDRDRYIFVNERGQKIADLSAVKLAQKLSHNVRPLTSADKLSVVDQSMYNTLEQAQKSLCFARNHDSLTKLINRDTFLSQMKEALHHAQTRNSQHAVLYLDIDQFKLVNEIYDRLEGDQVLLEFANLLSQLNGKKSSSARIEGDKFAILLLDKTLEQAAKTAEKIGQDIENSSIEINTEAVSFTVSTGVAPLLAYSSNVDQTLEHAHAAMRQAKKLGGNQVACFEMDPEALESSRHSQLATRKRIQETLNSDQFVLRAQSIVQTPVNGVSPSSQHYRLQLGTASEGVPNPSPEEFLDSARHCGYMILVDRWLIKQAFGWVSQLMDAQKVVPNLIINLACSSATDSDFTDYLLDHISEYGVGTSRLCFEIKEISTTTSLVRMADFIQTFRNIGCQFVVDGYGTGLDDLNFLRELPVDYVKISPRFFANHEDEMSNDFAMARSINDLAHFLGQKTVCEPVDDDSITSALSDMGVDYMQGWANSSPKLLREIADETSSIDR